MSQPTDHARVTTEWDEARLAAVESFLTKRPRDEVALGLIAEVRRLRALTVQQGLETQQLRAFIAPKDHEIDRLRERLRLVHREAGVGLSVDGNAHQSLRAVYDLSDDV